MADKGKSGAMQENTNQPSCKVCGSTKDIEMYNVGNVGVSQCVSLCTNCCPKCKSNKEDSNYVNEHLTRIKVNTIVRQIWGALRELSDYRDGDAMTEEDLDLLMCINKHPAVQKVLGEDLESKIKASEAKG